MANKFALGFFISKNATISYLWKSIPALFILVSLINISSWFLNHDNAFVSIDYDSVASMKVFTALMLLLLGGSYIAKKSIRKYVLFAGVAICTIQLLVLIPFFNNLHAILAPSSEVTCVLFFLCFIERYMADFKKWYRLSFIINFIIYAVATFSVLFSLLDPDYLKSLAGFSSLSWNTSIILLMIASFNFQNNLHNKYRSSTFQFDNAADRFPHELYYGLFLIPILILGLSSILIKTGYIHVYFGLFIIIFGVNLFLLLVMILYTDNFINWHNELYKNHNIILEKNKYLNDFTCIASHNLRGPIISLENWIKILKDDEDLKDAMQHQKMQLLSQNITHLRKTTGSLHQFLKFIKTDKATISYEYISQTIRYVKLLLASETPINTQYNIDIVKNIKLPKVYMESILLNILSNAIKYKRKNEPLIIDINVSHSALTNETLIAITDNGMGINMDKHKNDLFKPGKMFHHLENINSNGFGLYITKMQVQSLSGTISIESKENLGTTVIVKIPTAFS
ncbi:ATP-binding protein [Zhouia sp. PK063]|uniref:sensor histidine kinase n=1 Tax=Zhouia sp. PK063 TaxID=3373602 RepID=UPI00378ECFFB